MNYETVHCEFCGAETIHLVVIVESLRILICLRHQADMILAGIQNEKRRAA